MSRIHTKNSDTVLSAFVPVEMAGMRLDQVLARLFPDYSRNKLQQWVRAGLVQVEGHSLRPRDKVWQGQELVVHAVMEPDERWQAQELPLDIVFEDEEILVINKQAGQVVHPAAGNRDGTLLNAILHYDSNLAVLPRAGIVHRLDKDTSGLLVVARTPLSQKRLIDQLQARSVSREYLALVVGVMTAGGKIDAPIGRHPVQRKRMAVIPNGKQAITHYRIEKRLKAHSLLRVKLETGRTHQIRVHMASINHPIVGDPTYGGRLKLPAGCSDLVKQALRSFKRQALHATRLGLSHPKTGERLEWECPLPQDMQQLLDILTQDAERQD